MKQPLMYHNPTCSKSRATLALLQSRGYEPELIHYLEAPPDGQTLRQLGVLLGLPIRSLIRSKESAYAELNLDLADEAQLLNAVSTHPILMERPIVVMGQRAVIGRPPENVLTLLPDVQP